jgi:hypothetical protein
MFSSPIRLRIVVMARLLPVDERDELVRSVVAAIVRLALRLSVQAHVADEHLCHTSQLTKRRYHKGESPDLDLGPAARHVEANCRIAMVAHAVLTVTYPGPHDVAG